MAPSEFAQVLDASGIHTTRVLHPLVEHTGTKLETLALYPAGKACTMPLTRIGSPGKIEPHGRTGLCRLQKKPLASFPKDSLAAN